MFSLNPRTTLFASVLAAVGASLCCVAPLALLAMGIGGSWIANLARFEPLRPVFTALTVLLLGLAWSRTYRKADNCGSGACPTDSLPQQRQRQIFWLVAVPSVILLAFPWFAPLFY